MLREKSAILAWSALLALLIVGAFGCSRERAPRQPSLVLVTLDTVRADHLGCYGDRDAVTPSLDRLAKEGLRFANVSSAVPLTLPSHTSLLTGLLPPHHGLRNNGAGALRPGTATLATLLAGAGYRTGAFIGAFVLDHRFGLKTGFEVYDDEIERDPKAGNVLEAERPGREVVDRALAWLEKDDGRPFFLWVHLYDAHAPYTPPPAWAARHPGRPYDGEISEVDEQVGRILEALRRRGLDGKTAVAVVADHGEGLGEHGELTHGLLLYEPTLHVPLLLRAPWAVKPRVVETPVSLVDLAPTLAGLLGRPFPGPLDGRDLSRALRSGGEPALGELYAETRYPATFGWTPLSALRRRDLKYISASRPELYDLRRDPREGTDLLQGPSSSAPEARGFAARLAAIEASAVATAPPLAADAETRAKLASLGYIAGGPGSAGGPASGPSGEAAKGRPIDPKAMVDLFQRFERANERLTSGDARAAVSELEALVAADPANPVFRGKLGAAWREQGSPLKALPFYRQAADAAPRDPEAWYNLASALQEAGRPDEARQAIERALQLDAGRPEAHNTLGIIELGQGNLEQARREFTAATAIDPRDAAAFNNLGNVLREEHKLDDAANAYQRSAALAPRYAEPLNGLGTLEVERDRPREALPLFESALALAPGYHEVRLNQAIAHDLAGDADAALSAYRDFLNRTAGDPKFSEQRRAAQQLLARLEGRIAGGAPAERR
ncbi:MAG TPA: sulfatase-like hydrolase/transferase [Thermoanaerobaculia bacterium]|nr:sulfatase-like hydrolase/transferase [Thermoanaerobaculia bacterium]